MRGAINNKKEVIMIDNLNKQSGFTLVEMAIGMVVVGLLVGFATIGFSSALRFGFEKKTFADMEVVANAIAVYAQKHMRVPCPADPTGVTGATAGGEPLGTERGSVDGTLFGQCNTLATAEGAIPFATLGLPQRYARDRFGNLLTYKVSITSALRPTDTSGDTVLLNNWCRTEPHWYADTNDDGTTDADVARAKAAFCCGVFITPGLSGRVGMSGDVIIEGSFGALPNLSRTFGAGGFGLEYSVPTSPPPNRQALVDPGLPSGSPTPTVPPSFPAYVIISHGQNGENAYISETGLRPPAIGSVAERENADGDVIIKTTDRLNPNDPGAANRLYRTDIDDIVFWQTPAQVLSRIGGLSCGRP